MGHQVSHQTVALLLRSLGYSLQANVKVREGRQHPDRDAQFHHINATVKADERHKLMADAQRLVAHDAVAAYLYQPTWITVAKAGLKGVWKDMPLSVNDFAAMSWQ